MVAEVLVQMDRQGHLAVLVGAEVMIMVVQLLIRQLAKHQATGMVTEDKLGLVQVEA